MFTIYNLLCVKIYSSKIRHLFKWKFFLHNCLKKAPNVLSMFKHEINDL